MLHALEWTTALLGLIAPRGAARSSKRRAGLSNAPFAPDNMSASGDDEREPFHLDDTEIAARLRDGSDVLYRTPPHAHLVFPMLRVR